MPKKQFLYTCPRCGYETKYKNFMRNHLYKLKKQCSGVINPMELTDDIKEHIIANRIWHPPPPQHPPLPPPVEKPQNLTINQNINQYNIMTNLVTRIDDLKKLEAYTEYNDIPLLNFSDEVDEMYKRKRGLFETMKSKNIFLDQTNIYDAIDDVTSIKDLTQLNILYEEVAQKLRIFDDNEWRTVLFDTGISEIIERIKEYYLDVYEQYLLRLYYDSSTVPSKKEYIREQMQEYYKFIACYELNPYVYNLSDNYILRQLKSTLTKEDDSYEISEKWYTTYKDVKAKLQGIYVNRIKKDVSNIVKRNAKSNVLELNKKVMELIRMDEDFKKDVLADVIGA